MTSPFNLLAPVLAAQKPLTPPERREERQLLDLLVYGYSWTQRREVCCRRARKLRRRGEDVRVFGVTTTGKARYIWFKRIPPMEVYLP